MRTGYARSEARSRGKIDTVEPLRSTLPLMELLGRFWQSAALEISDQPTAQPAISRARR
jgi:hypothetical protein